MTTDLLSVVNGLVFDGVGPEPVECPIHTDGGRIVGLEGPPPEAARVIDARGRVVTPGLIDAHLHAYTVSVDLLENEALPMSFVAAKAARRLEGALRRGFTTVRDVAGGDIGLRMAIGEGLIEGPRYLFTGPGLTQTGGHGDPRPGHLAIEVLGHHAGEIADGVDALLLAVRERFRTGAHAIKIFTSGGVASPTDPLRSRQYSAEEVRAVCDEASRRDSYVAAHAYSPRAIIHSVTNGVRTIEHGNLLNQQAAELMAEHGAYLVPTLIAYDAMGRRGPGLGLSLGLRAQEPRGTGSGPVVDRHRPQGGSTHRVGNRPGRRPGGRTAARVQEPLRGPTPWPMSCAPRPRSTQPSCDDRTSESSGKAPPPIW